MRLLIAGNLGSMGIRYTAICKYLGHEVIGYDLCDTATLPPIADKVIIATPVQSHLQWCLWAINEKIPFLCEKPISYSIEETQELRQACESSGVSGYMVNNWQFVLPGEFLQIGMNDIMLNYYNTGRDGIYDLIQPCYLARYLKVNKESPFYNSTVNGYHVTQYNFDKSYVNMIEKFIDDNSQYLWTMYDA
jgi:hypothetical protein